MKKITAITLALIIILSALSLSACGDKTPADNGTGNSAGNASNGASSEPATNNSEESVYATVAKILYV